MKIKIILSAIFMATQLSCGGGGGGGSGSVDSGSASKDTPPTSDTVSITPIKSEQVSSFSFSIDTALFSSTMTQADIDNGRIIVRLNNSLGQTVATTTAKAMGSTDAISATFDTFESEQGTALVAIIEPANEDPIVGLITHEKSEFTGDNVAIKKMVDDISHGASSVISKAAYNEAEQHIQALSKATVNEYIKYGAFQTGDPQIERIVSTIKAKMLSAQNIQNVEMKCKAAWILTGDVDQSTHDINLDFNPDSKYGTRYRSDANIPIEGFNYDSKLGVFKLRIKPSYISTKEKARIEASVYIAPELGVFLAKGQGNQVFHVGLPNMNMLRGKEVIYAYEKLSGAEHNPNNYAGNMGYIYHNGGQDLIINFFGALNSAHLGNKQKNVTLYFDVYLNEGYVRGKCHLQNEMFRRSASYESENGIAIDGLYYEELLYKTQFQYAPFWAQRDSKENPIKYLSHELAQDAFLETEKKAKKLASTFMTDKKRYYREMYKLIYPKHPIDFKDMGVSVDKMTCKIDDPLNVIKSTSIDKQEQVSIPRMNFTAIFNANYADLISPIVSISAGLVDQKGGATVDISQPWSWGSSTSKKIGNSILKANGLTDKAPKTFIAVDGFPSDAAGVPMYLNATFKDLNEESAGSIICKNFTKSPIDFTRSPCNQPNVTHPGFGLKTADTNLFPFPGSSGGSGESDCSKIIEAMRSCFDAKGIHFEDRVDANIDEQHYYCHELGDNDCANLCGVLCKCQYEGGSDEIPSSFNIPSQAPIPSDTISTSLRVPSNAPIPSTNTTSTRVLEDSGCTTTYHGENIFDYARVLSGDNVYAIFEHDPQNASIKNTAEITVLSNGKLGKISNFRLDDDYVTKLPIGQTDAQAQLLYVNPSGYEPAKASVNIFSNYTFGDVSSTFWSEIKLFKEDGSVYANISCQNAAHTALYGKSGGAGTGAGGGGGLGGTASTGIGLTSSGILSQTFVDNPCFLTWCTNAWSAIKDFDAGYDTVLFPNMDNYSGASLRAIQIYRDATSRHIGWKHTFDANALRGLSQSYANPCSLYYTNAKVGQYMNVSLPVGGQWTSDQGTTGGGAMACPTDTHMKGFYSP